MRRIGIVIVNVTLLIVGFLLLRPVTIDEYIATIVIVDVSLIVALRRIERQAYRRNQQATMNLPEYHSSNQNFDADSSKDDSDEV